MLEELLAATAEYSPVVMDEACEEFPGMQKPDWVVRYGQDLCAAFIDGKYYVKYEDWTGQFENPVPALVLILSGNVVPGYTSAGDTILFLVDDEPDTETIV